MILVIFLIIFSRILADVGVTMGLYLGACLLTLLELIHFIFAIDEEEENEQQNSTTVENRTKR